MKQGFSILEITVVMLLMAILFSLTIPQFNRLFQSSLDTEIRKVLSLVEDVRFSSILEGNRYRVRFYPVNKAFEINHFQNGKWSPVNDEKPVMLNSNISSISLNIDGQDYSAAEQVDVYFYPSGLVDPFQLILKDGEESREFQMQALTGATEIVEP